MTEYPEPEQRTLKTHGITRKQWWEMFGDGVCPICTRKYRYDIIQRRAVVDHNHWNFEVRGMLCSGCNYELGCMHDDVEWLENAASYLREPPASKLFDPVPLHSTAPVRYRDRLTKQEAD